MRALKWISFFSLKVKFAFGYTARISKVALESRQKNYFNFLFQSVLSSGGGNFNGPAINIRFFAASVLRFSRFEQILP